MLRVIAGSMAASGRAEEGIDLLHETLALSWAVGDIRGAGHSWDLLGQTYRLLGDRDNAVANWEQAADIYRQSRTPAALAEVLLNIGDALDEAGERVNARGAWQEALIALGEPTSPLAHDLQSRLKGG